MAIENRNCFGSRRNKKHPTTLECSILKTDTCLNCPFYKKRDDVKNNVFYRWSFDNITEYKSALLAYKNKYGCFPKDED